MTIKQLIKLEDKAKEVWVVSPGLHFDVENNDFSELVSVNLGEKTKYRYIVPATASVMKNIKKYKKLYKLTSQELKDNFLILPDTEFNPFVTEVAIYNGSKDPVACCTPSHEDNNTVIKFSDETAAQMAKSFKAIWKKYKMTNP